MRVPWAPFNLGIFLIIFGGLMFTSLAQISPYTPLQSFTLTIMIFGVWLALAAFIVTPSQYAMPRTIVFTWGAVLASLGVLFFVVVTSVPALPLVFSILIVVAGIGALGYSLMRAVEGGNRRNPPTGTSNL